MFADETTQSQTLSAVRAVTLRDLVYENVLQAILEKKLKPGDHLREDQLASMLNVSRTPMREALTLLVRDGFVRYYHNRGWFVATYQPDEIREIFALRAGLENLAADLTLGKLGVDELNALEAMIKELGRPEVQIDEVQRYKVDRNFHQYIVRVANNQRLYQIWERIYAQCALVFNYHTVTLPHYDHYQGVIDHTSILEALRSGDIARVHAANNEINQRVAAQCIEGYLALQGK